MLSWIQLVLIMYKTVEPRKNIVIYIVMDNGTLSVHFHGQLDLLKTLDLVRNIVRDSWTQASQKHCQGQLDTGQSETLSGIVGHRLVRIRGIVDTLGVGLCCVKTQWSKKILMYFLNFSQILFAALKRQFHKTIVMVFS